MISYYYRPLVFNTTVSCSGKCTGMQSRKSAHSNNHLEKGKNMLDVIIRIAEAVIDELKKNK